MIGIIVGEDNTYLECYPIFTNFKLGFRVKLPFHLGCRRSGEYGIAWSRRFSMWSMWGNSGYPSNPFSAFWRWYIVPKYRRWKHW